MTTEEGSIRMSMDARARAVCDAIDDRFESAQVPWLRTLVNQPSHSGAKEDVEAAASIVDEMAERLGLSRTLHPDAEGRFAAHRVYATPATADDDTSIALVGHVDTVFPRSLGFLTFARDDGPQGPETGDVVRGPGVADMKSGLSAIVFALAAVRDVLGADYGGLRVRFVCNTDEEVGSPSSAGLFAELAPRLSEAMVFEHGREGDRVVVSRKGGATFVLTAHGRAAHAGNRHADGVNAIAALAYQIPRIEALTDYAREVTVNVGLVEGGTAKNTVPDRARCTIDARFARQTDGESLVRALETMAREGLGDEAPPRLRQATFELGGRISRPPLEPTAASTALRLRYEACAGAVGLGAGEAPRQGGGSDANLLAAAGIPTIDGLGPYGQHAHDVREWASLESLRRRTKALAMYLAKRGEG